MDIFTRNLEELSFLTMKDRLVSHLKKNYKENIHYIKGSRYVFKKPLFVNNTSTKIIETNEADDGLCDGGLKFEYGGGADY